MRSLVAGILLVVAVLGFVAYRTSQRSAPVVAPDALVNTVTKQEVGETYEIDATYPRFGIAPLDLYIAEAELRAIQEVIDAPAALEGQKNSFESDFRDVYIGPDFISVKLVLSQYMGGAHPMTIVSGVNYSVASSSIMSLHDVLPLTGLSIEELSEQSTARLEETLGENLFAEGANTNPENFSSFSISTSTVTFIFQPYQVAAYAAGVQEVAFPRIH